MAYFFPKWLLATGTAAGLLLSAPAARAATPPLDSMRTLLRQPGLADTTRVEHYSTMSQLAMQQSLDTAQHYAEVGLALAQRIGFLRGELFATRTRAAILYYKSDFKEAQRAFEATARLSRRMGKCSALGNALMGMGNVALATGNTAGALRYLEEARTTFGGCPSLRRNDLLMVLSNLGNTYLENHQPEKAAPPLRQALAMVQQNMRLGKEVIVGSDDYVVPAVLINLLDLIGMLQAAEHHPDSAVVTWKRELVMAQTMKELRGQGYALEHLAETLLQQGQPAAALPYARQAVVMARQLGNQGQVTADLLTMARVLRALNRPEAYDTLARYAALRDTTLQREQTQSVADAQARFDAAGKQAQIEKLKQQRRIERLEADQQAVRTQLITASAVALALMLLGAVLLYLRLRRASAALAVSEAQARAAEAEARRAVATKDQLMSIIGHDLRSPVATFQQVTPLLHHFADEPNAAAQHEIVTALDANAHHLGALLDNLLYWARAEAGSLLNHPQALPVAEVLTQAAAPYTAGAQLKGITLTTAVFGADGDLTDPLLVSADPDLLRTVLRNLVSNAVKFTPDGGHIRLRAWVERPGHVTLEVRDTGVGIAPERAAQLFSAGETTSTPGTAGEHGTGLGLPLSARFVRLLHSELRLLPPVAGQPGTAFRFELPLEYAYA